MEPEKDIWINTVLSSLDGLQRAEPSPVLFAKIRNRLESRSAVVYVPPRLVWLAAGSFVLLLFVNWQIASGLLKSSQPNTTGLTTVIAGMNLYPTSTNIYDTWNGQNY